MRSSLFVFAFLFPLGARADNLCNDLSPNARAGRWAIAAATCDEKSAAACDRLSKALADCLKQNSVPVITSDGLKAAAREQVLKQALIGTSSDQLVAFGKAADVRYLALAEVHYVDGADAGLVKVIDLQDGSVWKVARYQSGAAGKDAQAQSVSESLARLAEKLATGFTALGAQSKRKRVAVLNFQEHGDIAKKNALGTLVSAELVTRFRRDYGLLVVERSRLDAVLKELELGQTGLVDDKVAPKLGKLVEADVLVLGAVNDAGEVVRANAQMIDVATGVTIVADSVDMKAGSLITLSRDAVVLRSKSGALFRSLLIPGWGQFYNRQTIKGTVVLSLAGALAAAAVSTEIFASIDASAYSKARAGANFNALATRVDNFDLARNVLIGVLAAVWVYNVIDAYVFGVTFDSATNASAGGASVSLTPFGCSGSFK